MFYVFTNIFLFVFLILLNLSFIGQNNHINIWNRMLRWPKLQGGSWMASMCRSIGLSTPGIWWFNHEFNLGWWRQSHSSVYSRVSINICRKPHQLISTSFRIYIFDTFLALVVNIQKSKYYPKKTLPNSEQLLWCLHLLSLVTKMEHMTKTL